MKSFPFDAKIVSWGEDGLPVFDRSYTADELRSVFGRLFTNGVFMDVPNAFKVSASSNMTVIVSVGDCIVRGTYGWEESQRSLQLQAASSKDRIDTVVLRWNNEVEQRKIDLYVVTGTAADNPTRPALTRTELVYELGICDIFVPKNTTAVASSRITDTRLETARCGQALPFAKLDTTSFYNYLNSSLSGMVGELQKQTNTAVQLAQSALDGTTAGHLQNQIDGKVSKSGDTISGNLTVNKLLTIKHNENDSETCVTLQKLLNNGTNNQLNLGVKNDGMTWISVSNAGQEVNYLILSPTYTGFKQPLSTSSGGTGTKSVFGQEGFLKSLFGAAQTGYNHIPVFNDGWANGGYMSTQQLRNAMGLGNTLTAMSDFVVASGSGYVGEGENTGVSIWIKFNSGICIIGVSKSKTTVAGNNNYFGVHLPFNISGVIAMGVSAYEPANPGVYVGYANTTENLVDAYMNGCLGGKTGWMRFFLIARWK